MIATIVSQKPIGVMLFFIKSKSYYTINAILFLKRKKYPLKVKGQGQSQNVTDYSIGSPEFVFNSPPFDMDEVRLSIHYIPVHPLFGSLTLPITSWLWTNPK